MGGSAFQGKLKQYLDNARENAKENTTFEPVEEDKRQLEQELSREVVSNLEVIEDEDEEVDSDDTTIGKQGMTEESTGDSSKFMNPPIGHVVIDEGMEILDSSFLCAVSGIEKFVLTELDDNTGYFSNKVSERALLFNSSCVPASSLKFAVSVNKLRDYDIFVYNNHKYFMNKTADHAKINQYKESIIKAISSGNSYSVNILQRIAVDGVTYENFILSQVELSILVAIFSDYGAHVKGDSDGVYLTVKGV